MPPEQVSAEWASYDRKCREKRNRQENYRKLEAFCQYNARQAANELQEIYDKMEAIYKNHVLEYVEMDEIYGRKAKELYDACTSYHERIWDMEQKARQAMEDLWRGTLNTAWDGAKGTIGLVYSLGKLQVALQIGAATDVLGITPQWIHQTRKDACETARGMVEILKAPMRVLESLGQSIGDTIDEKGIPYAVGYVAGDIVIGIFLGKGLGKLGKVGKVDDLARIGSSADEIADAAKAAKTVDAVVDTVDEVSDAGRVATNVAEEARRLIQGGSDIIDYVKLSDELGNKIEIDGYKIIDIEDAATANADWADMGYDLPPVAAGTKVYNVEAGNYQYARVFKEGVNKPKSPFILRADDIQGLSASEIAEKYALPQVPDKIVYPKIPCDTSLEVSIVGPQELWGTVGGDAQYAIKDALLDDDWFTDIHDLK